MESRADQTSVCVLCCVTAHTGRLTAGSSVRFTAAAAGKSSSSVSANQERGAERGQDTRRIVFLRLWERNGLYVFPIKV